MTKEEYTKRTTELNCELRSVRKEYIKSNSPFPIGSKVKVTNDDGVIGYGFVTGYEIGPCEEVRPIVHKMKKDGTMHQTATYYIWHTYKIEPCNE